jgi:hypothetical protein
MGKAAERRKRSNEQFLTRLAQNNPERFRVEWAKRVISMAYDIRDNGRNGLISVPTVFEKADEAKQVLASFGAKAATMEISSTADVLENECCRLLAAHSKDKLRKADIYSVNQDYEAHGCYKVYRDKKE